MKLDMKTSTVLAVGGIILASAFLVIAIISPETLDGILNPSDDRRDSIKREMERQKSLETDGQSDARLRQVEEAKSGATTPIPSPEETAPAVEREMRTDQRISKPECISRDQVTNLLAASEEAREGRVMGISVTSDGARIRVTYRKKTFLGIGSGENQIEGILRRGLKSRFPDQIIQSLKVRSDGNRSVRQGERYVSAEALLIENRQAGCRWP